MSAESFFDRFVNLERSPRIPYPLKIDRMKHLLRALDLPAKPFGVITVAGSKGKGSASSMIASILDAAGETTGFYSSPHLVTWHERLRVNGTPITENEADAVVRFMERKMAAADFPYGPPTYFEAMTAAAFLHFKERDVRTAVLEVGLGGEFDAVNALDADVAVIMPIGREHEAVLGPTLEKIASAKCGILRRGGIAVVSLQTDEAMRVIKKRAAETGARLFSVAREIEIIDEGASARFPARFSGTGPSSCTATGGSGTDPSCREAAGGESQSFRLKGPWGEEGPFEIRLLGRHQVENAAAAYLAVRKYFELKLRTVDPRTITDGFGRAAWPARVEKIADSPAVVIDGAHTGESAAALVAALRRHFRFRKLRLVLGMLDDKDPVQFLASFKGLAETVWFVPVKSERSFRPAELMAKTRELGLDAREGSLGEALESARAASGPEDIIVVTGSLYLMADAKECVHAAAVRR